MVILISALLTAASGVSSALRARHEETSGRAEPVLATRTSRWSWLAGHLTVTLAGSAVVLAAAGFGHGLSYGIAISDPGQIPRLSAAALVQLPAVWLVVAVAVLGIGWPSAWRVVSSGSAGATSATERESSTGRNAESRWWCASAWVSQRRAHAVVRDRLADSADEFCPRGRLRQVNEAGSAESRSPQAMRGYRDQAEHATRGERTGVLACKLFAKVADRHLRVQDLHHCPSSASNDAAAAAGTTSVFGPMNVVPNASPPTTVPRAHSSRRSRRLGTDAAASRTGITRG